MSSSTAMLGPVIALVAWSMVMWLWMYATRIDVPPEISHRTV